MEVFWLVSICGVEIGVMVLELSENENETFKKDKKLQKALEDEKKLHRLTI